MRRVAESRHDGIADRLNDRAIVAHGHVMQTVEMLLHQRKGVEVADPFIECGGALESVKSSVMSLMPSPSLVTSERNRSRNVCVDSSRLPERNGAKCSGGRDHPGGKAMIPKSASWRRHCRSRT